mmetsp:Transcript_38577/g.75748  ORF Transcript_38577/g.75748 Transcript_38577/m.75748 type:complete len:163 (+) Transcript_38577:272-760(+)
MTALSALLVLLLSLSLHSVGGDGDGEDFVVVLTDDNMREFVSKNSRVLVEFYAPWCGHCKRLEPIYTEFAEAMATELPSLMVGKMDGTANESPVENFDWTGFPTIFYIKYDDVQAAKKEGKAYDPMKYNGARTVEGLKEFALKNVSPSLAKEGGATGHAEEL